MIARVYRETVLNAALAFCLALAAVGCGAPATPEPVRLAETRRLMGVPWAITLYAPTADIGRTALAAAFAEVERLEGVLSDYDPASELSRLSAAAPTHEPVAVSDDLWRVLERSVEFRDATDGAFDPTVGPLTWIWRQARRSGRLPPEEKMAAARAAVGTDALALSREPRGVLLPRPATRLDLGGIGMGYAADRALDVLARRGIASAMIDASGDIAVSAAPPGAPGWRIAVAALDPAGKTLPPLILAHAAVTTSGDAFQGVQIDGVRYSHIVDPRTGLGVVGSAAVTVIGPDCATADALATAASVLGPGPGLEAVQRIPGCAARFVWLENGDLREATSPGWPSQSPQSAAADGRL